MNGRIWLSFVILLDFLLLWTCIPAIYIVITKERIAKHTLVKNRQDRVPGPFWVSEGSLSDLSADSLEYFAKAKAQGREDSFRKSPQRSQRLFESLPIRHRWEQDYTLEWGWMWRNRSLPQRSSGWLDSIDHAIGSKTIYEAFYPLWVQQGAAGLEEERRPDQLESLDHLLQSLAVFQYLSAVATEWDRRLVNTECNHLFYANTRGRRER